MMCEDFLKFLVNQFLRSFLRAGAEFGEFRAGIESGFLLRRNLRNHG